ncbi:MAG: dihydroorotate dehydrogenase electron transfer subunit [Chloroflexi bacterium]|nr:dihydroorotate dehydrogenase electron transfer subunit [Chloroflexota bacterium]
MRPVQSRLLSNTEITPGVRLLWLECTEISSSAKPGQYVMVRCDDGLEYLLRRPLTIHQTERHRIALLFAVVGKGTAWLSQRKTGENIDLLGPLGNGYSVEAKTRQLLLVAGGMGIAPLRYLAQEALRRGSSVTLLLGAQTASCLYPVNLVPMGIKLGVATDDGSAGTNGLVTSLLPDYIDRADQVFVCGPLPMYREMYKRRDTLLKGKPVQVSLEVRMACGLGVCYGCTVKTKRGLKQVCKDGPVFGLDDVLWDEPFSPGGSCPDGQQSNFLDPMR